MLYREMKKTGDRLSILGFGCMRLPQKFGSPGNGRIDEKAAQALLRRAIDGGVNYIDTAYLYHLGASEPFLGRALSDGYREKVKLATKLPPWLINNKADMDKILNIQLNRLQTEQIDYYLIHALNRASWHKMKSLGVADFLDRAKKDGRIAHVGFSFHGEQEEFFDIIDDYDWYFSQIQYNILDELNQAGTKGLQYAASKDIGVIVMEPLRGGLLAQKPPPAIEAIWDEAETKRSPAEWALRWIWDHPEVIVVLSGMNDQKQVQENLKIAGEAHPESLSEKELSLVERVEQKYRDLMKVGCTSCHYCMPCPYNVNIPYCFEIYNSKYLRNDAGQARHSYALRLGGLGGNTQSSASQCRECGKCLELCPQGIQIPDELKVVAAEMEGPFFNSKLWVFNKYVQYQKWALKRAEGK